MYILFWNFKNQSNGLHFNGQRLFGIQLCLIVITRSYFMFIFIYIVVCSFFFSSFLLIWWHSYSFCFSISNFEILLYFSIPFRISLFFHAWVIKHILFEDYLKIRYQLFLIQRHYFPPTQVKLDWKYFLFFLLPFLQS